MSSNVAHPRPRIAAVERYTRNLIRGSAHVYLAQETIKRPQQLMGEPSMIIALTVKGKGVSYMENECDWHTKAPNKEHFEQATADFFQRRGFASLRKRKMSLREKEYELLTQGMADRAIGLQEHKAALKAQRVQTPSWAMATPAPAPRSSAGPPAFGSFRLEFFSPPQRFMKKSQEHVEKGPA